MIEAALTFLVRADAKPKVLMPADPADRVERTGRYAAVPVAIHDARRLSMPPTLDEEGFALVRSPTAVTDFLDPAVSRIDGRLRAVVRTQSMVDHRFTAPGLATDFDDEAVESRLARRGRTWIGSVTMSPPLELHFGA